MDYRKFFRNYLEFYPSEKKGVFLLSLLILIWIIALFVYTRMPGKIEDDVAFEEAVNAYYAAQVVQDRSTPAPQPEGENKLWNLFSFNPNTLSKDSFQLLGLSERVANNIVKYRESGGSFKSRDDLSRIYSLSSADFEKIKQYIQIPTQREEYTPYESAFDETQAFGDAAAPSRSRAQIIVELNTADTNELKQIFGIGSFFAREIVNRREALGGYLHLGQLLEIYNLDSAHLDQIAPHLTLDAQLVRKININTVSMDELRKHPYFPYTIANSLVRIREAHGPFSSVEEVKKSHLITDSMFQHIQPYLSVHD